MTIKKLPKTIIIGIAGGSASGKSTFAAELKETLKDQRALKVLDLHMDAYFKEPAQRPVANAPVTGKPYRDDNHPDTVDLNRLKQDLQMAEESGEYQVIILEGLLTLWEKEICDRLDLRLYVECRPDERIVRRLRRNMGWGLSFDEISDVYLDLVRYRHDEYVEPSKWQADFILNGSKPSERALEAVVLYICSLL